MTNTSVFEFGGSLFKLDEFDGDGGHSPAAITLLLDSRILTRQGFFIDTMSEVGPGFLSQAEDTPPKEDEVYKRYSPFHSST